MGCEYKFRSATPDDIPRMQELDELMKSTHSDEYFEDNLRWIRICEYEGAPIAYCMATNEKLRNMVVQSDYQRHGIGRMFVDLMESEMPKCETGGIVAHTRESNMQARKFYEGSGFELAEVKPKYYLNGEDAYEYVRKCKC